MSDDALGDSQGSAYYLAGVGLLPGARRNAPASPWQNPHCGKRFIGSIRRECLDHVIVMNDRHLMRVLRGYASYNHSSRTHQSLENDCPDPRPVEPPKMGDVVAIAQVGGLHHRYARRLAA